MKYGFLSDEELAAVGLRTYGRNVLIHNTANIVAPENLRVGDNTRIDAFVTLSAHGGWITIDRNVHIGSYCYLAGGGGIAIAAFAGLSQGVKLYSVSDDYSGEHMTNPTVCAKFTGVRRDMVILGQHVIIGAGSVVLPGVTIQNGAAVGALSLVKSNLDAWGIYAGVPVKRLRNRNPAASELGRQYLIEHG